MLLGSSSTASVDCFAQWSSKQRLATVDDRDAGDLVASRADPLAPFALAAPPCSRMTPTDFSRLPTATCITGRLNTAITGGNLAFAVAGRPPGSLTLSLARTVLGREMGFGV